MRFNTLDDWLSWQQTLHPHKIDLGLQRVQDVLGKLEIRRPEYRVLTVAGTNGKGSTVAVCANILTAAGYRVGTFTSPHLFHYRERVVIDGQYLDDAQWLALFDAVDQARGSTSLTYFEFGFVAAALAFSRANIHVAMLEVGLGGRLDAVNALDPDAAVVVSVALDHMGWLGEDREAIGFEKAGVFRAGRPAVVADPDPPRSVIDHAKSLGANLCLRGSGFGWETDAQGDRWRYWDDRVDLQDLPLPGGEGGYLLANAAGALALLSSVSAKLPLPLAAVVAGLSKPGPRGRLERHQIDGVEWIFDVAHNPHGAAALARAIMPLSSGRCYGLVAVMADKDIAAMLHEINGLVDEWWATTTGTERGADPSVVAEELSQLGAECVAVSPDLAAALQHLKASVVAGDRVIVLGSFHTVGPALRYLGLY